MHLTAALLCSSQTARLRVGPCHGGRWRPCPLLDREPPSLVFVRLEYVWALILGCPFMFGTPAPDSVPRGCGDPFLLQSCSFILSMAKDKSCSSQHSTPLTTSLTATYLLCSKGCPKRCFFFCYPLHRSDEVYYSGKKNGRKHKSDKGNPKKKLYIPLILAHLPHSQPNATQS
jgi:hypothetical protein